MEEELKSFNLKKYFPFLGIAVLIIAVIAIIITVFGGGPKKSVKKFVKALDKCNASKLSDCIDFAASDAWMDIYLDEFDKDDYKDFKEEIKEVDKDDIKEDKKDFRDYMKEGFEEIKEECKSFKVKIEKIKSVKKLHGKVYKVEAIITVQAKSKDDDEIDETETITFIVYKNKIVYSTIFDELF